MKILACQVEIPPVHTKDAKSQHLETTARKISGYLEAASQKNDLVMLPELSSVDYSRAAFENLSELGENIHGESYSVFSQVAAKYEVFISFGIPRKDGDEYYISQVILNSSGEYVGHYDKLHIAHFGASMEKDYFKTGNQFLVFEVNGIRVAPTICYDLRFPELFRELCVLRGADLILHSVAFYRDESFPSWHHFAITRAMENQVFFMSLNRAGEGYGSSIFCPTWIDDDVQPVIFPREESFQGFEIDSQIIRQAREIFPFRKDKREDYSGL